MSGRRNGPVWVTSGLHLAAPTEDGRVAVTPDLLRAWLMRAELRPIPESCDAERALHAALVENPRRRVGAEEVAAVSDEDGRENFRLFLRFRDWLADHGSVEAAFLALHRVGLSAPPLLPPLFRDQMVHLIVANLFEGPLRGATPLHARAAELLFREQRVATDTGLVLADAEVVDAAEGSEGAALFRMVEEAGTARRGVTLDVLSEDDAGYWKRADRFDSALDFRVGQAAPEAFADVLAAWVRHMLGPHVRVEPVAEITDGAWRWHVGLDAEASVLLDRLYAGEDLGEDARRIASLFRLDFEDQAAMREDVRGRPVWMALGFGEDGRMRVKPQNLLTNLPLDPSLAPDIPRSQGVPVARGGAG